MSEQYFFNLHDMSQGISRNLAEGLDTRIFPGENVMLSVVRIGANKSGEIHSHSQEQWGSCWRAAGCASRMASSTKCAPVIFGRRRDRLNIASRQVRKALLFSMCSVRRVMNIGALAQAFRYRSRRFPTPT